MKIYTNIPDLNIPWVEYRPDIPDSNDENFFVVPEETSCEKSIPDIGKIIKLPATMSKLSYPDFICEKIRDHVAVHAYGDSHSIITYKIPICRENWLGFSTLPITMTDLKNGLDLHSAIQTINNGHEQYPIRPGDWALYFYGEVDIREGLIQEETIPVVIDRYIRMIKQNEEKYRCKSAIYGIHPVIQGNNTELNMTRKKLRESLCNSLYTRCRQEGIQIVDISPEICSDDGYLNISCLKNPGEIHIKFDLYHILRDKIMCMLTGQLDRSDDPTFIVPVCLWNDQHVKSWLECKESIRKFHPDSQIIAILDSTSTIDIFDSVIFDSVIPEEKNLVVKISQKNIASDMLLYDKDIINLAKSRDIFTLQDSMRLKCPVTNHPENIEYLWYFTNHRVHWHVIEEPHTPENKALGISTHDDLVRYCIENYTEGKFQQYLRENYPKKDTWVGCFGSLTRMNTDFLHKLLSETKIDFIMKKMGRDNRKRRAVESIFSLAVQFTLGRIPEVYDGLYYDGNNNGPGHGLVGDKIEKVSHNRVDPIIP